MRAIPARGRPAAPAQKDHPRPLPRTRRAAPPKTLMRQDGRAADCCDARRSTLDVTADGAPQNGLSTERHGSMRRDGGTLVR
jgi:hypothetical protein